jgi:hypothetical protein
MKYRIKHRENNNLLAIEVKRKRRKKVVITVHNSRVWIGDVL